jgi:hypothetical protein
MEGPMISTTPCAPTITRTAVTNAFCVHLTNDLVDVIGDQSHAWRRGCVPPVPELMVLAELACFSKRASST